MFKTYIKPPMVLTIICVLVCSLLVFAYNLTYVDTTGQLTDTLKNAAMEIYPDGDFVLLTEKDENGDTVPMTLGNSKVLNVIKDNTSGNYLIEVLARGLNKDSLDALVAVTADGVADGIAVVASEDTPAYFDKANVPEYKDKFVGADSSFDFDSVDVVAGSTKSSGGIKNAFKTAVEAFNDNKEAITVE